MTRKDRTEGIFSRREVLDATERQNTIRFISKGF